MIMAVLLSVADDVNDVTSSAPSTVHGCCCKSYNALVQLDWIALHFLNLLPLLLFMKT